MTFMRSSSAVLVAILAAPIAIMLWLYLVSIAVLIGAALNASVDQIWPELETAEARRHLVKSLRLHRRRGEGH